MRAACLAHCSHDRLHALPHLDSYLGACMQSQDKLSCVPAPWTLFRVTQPEENQSNLRDAKVEALVPPKALAFVRELQEVNLSGTVWTAVPRAATVLLLTTMLYHCVPPGCRLLAVDVVALVPALAQLRSVKRLNLSSTQCRARQQLQCRQLTGAWSLHGHRQQAWTTCGSCTRWRCQAADAAGGVESKWYSRQRSSVWVQGS